jgi:hypothetical protein
MALGVDSASNRNDYQEHFLGVKDGQCAGLTTLLPSCADCIEIWEPEPPATLQGLSRPVMELLCLYSSMSHVPHSSQLPFEHTSTVCPTFRKRWRWRHRPPDCCVAVKRTKQLTTSDCCQFAVSVPYQTFGTKGHLSIISVCLLVLTATDLVSVLTRKVAKCRTI